LPLCRRRRLKKKVVGAVSETKAAEKIIILAFEDVHFDFDKSTLKPEAQAILKRNVQMLKDTLKPKSALQGIPLLPALRFTTRS